MNLHELFVNLLGSRPLLCPLSEVAVVDSEDVVVLSIGRQDFPWTHEHVMI